MALDLITIYLLLTWITCRAQIVSPTNETATAQNYWASLDDPNSNVDNGFQLGNIICASNKDCNIFCDIQNGCQFMTIDAKNANNLYIDCSGTSSCSLSEIHGPLSLISSVNIYCRNDKACDQTIFSINSSAIVNIFCSDSSSIVQSSCKQAKIYSASWNNINNNKINISCGIYDCNSIQLFANPFTYNTFLSCGIGSDSCTNMEINCIDNNNNNKSRLTYNNSLNQWECSIDYCCPIISNYNPNIECLAPICDINCTESNCMNRYIYGTTFPNLISMNIECNNCKSSKIICPMNAPCNIQCNAFESCQNILIDASLANKLTLICGENGCENAYILCPFNENSCEIECRGLPNSCYNMQIIQLTITHPVNEYLNIICPIPSTNPSFINACKNIRFQCEYGTIYYDTPNEINDLQTKCIQNQNINQCCPWQTQTDIGTTLTPTHSPLLPLLLPTIKPSNNVENTKDKGQSNNGQSNNELLLYIVIIGCGIVILCVAFWGFMFYKKNGGGNNSIENQMEGGIRNSKSLKKKSKNNKNHRKSGGHCNTNDTQSLNVTVPQIQSQLEIEKSMEMQSTSNRTITSYNPQLHAQNTTSHVMYERNISNPPGHAQNNNNTQPLGLADLGNSGWDD